MNAAEQRSVVADLREVDATVDLIGRVRLDGGAGPVVAEHAGVHRRGTLLANLGPELGGQPIGAFPLGDRIADVRWFETVMEWHERMPAP